MMEKSSSSRIFYIDALKAFAIVLVVIGHMSYLWTSPEHSSLYLPILSAFHMPLFMALSGYVTNVETFKLAKRAKLLIPFFVFGLAWTAYNQLPFLGFLENEAKYGYWFLYVLFMFCLFLAIIRKVNMNLYLGMAIVEVVLMGLHVCFHRTISGTTLSTDHMFQLWSFFCMGIILRRGLLDKLLSHNLIVSSVCVLMILGLWGGKLMLHLTETPAIYCNDAMSVFIVPLLFLVFHEAECRTKGKNSSVKRMIKCLGHEIGVSTLQIYVLQYFAISVFGYCIGKELPNNIIKYEWMLSPLLALVISYVCVLVKVLLEKMKLSFVFGR